MDSSTRRHVSKLVPSSIKALRVLVICVAIANSATLGYDSSMMTGLNILPQYNEYFNLNTATIGLNNAASWMGSILACFLMQPISDRFGRKKAILYASIICFVGVIIQTAAQNVAMFVVGRIIVGVGSGLSNSAAPTLIGETFADAQRGVYLGLFYSFYFVGALLSSGINYRTVDIGNTWAWRVPSVIQCVPSIISVALLPFVPESPRWLTINGKQGEAQEVLAIINGHPSGDTPEVEVIYRDLWVVLQREEELYPRNPWRELVSSPANRRRLAIVVTFGISTEMYGNFVASYYLGDMLTQAGITSTKTKLQISVILISWSMVCAICGSVLVEKIGRRLQAMSCTIGMVCCLFIFGGLTKLYGFGSTDKSGIYGTIAMIFLFKMFYAFAITPLTSIYPTEILPYKIRNTGVAIFRLVDGCFGLIASFAMSYAMDTLGWKFYFINGSWDLLFLACIYFLWVETKGISLEKIALEFGDLKPEDFLEGKLHDLDEITEPAPTVTTIKMD